MPSIDRHRVRGGDPADLRIYCKHSRPHSDFFLSTLSHLVRVILDRASPELGTTRRRQARYVPGTLHPGTLDRQDDGTLDRHARQARSTGTLDRHVQPPSHTRSHTQETRDAVQALADATLSIRSESKPKRPDFGDYFFRGGTRRVQLNCPTVELQVSQS